MERAVSRTRHATAAQGPLIVESPPSLPYFMTRRSRGRREWGGGCAGITAEAPFSLLRQQMMSSRCWMLLLLQAFPISVGFVTKRRPFFFFQIIRAPPYCAKINLFFFFFVSPLGALEPTCRFGASRNGRTSKKEAKIEAIPKSRFFPHGICLVEIFGSK